MSETELIRHQVTEAVARLDQVESERNEALGRQAAYRSRTWWQEGRENPNAGPRPGEDAPVVQYFRWVSTPTPEEVEFHRRRVESWGTPALEELIEAREALYNSEFNRAVEELKAGLTSGVEYAIAYLEADPWHFRSGYMKQDLARYLRRVPLSDKQRERLRRALLVAITKGRRQDLKEYVSLGRTLDTPKFREELRALLENSDAGTTYRAQRMLNACELNDRGRPRVGSHQPR